MTKGKTQVGYIYLKTSVEEFKRESLSIRSEEHTSELQSPS